MLHFLVAGELIDGELNIGGVVDIGGRRTDRFSGGSTDSLLD